MTFRIGENVKKICFVLTKREHRQFIQNVKVVAGEFQHALVLSDIDKSKISNVVRDICTEIRKIFLLIDVKIWK